MKAGLSRLLGAHSIAVIGGGRWCESIIGAAERIGYDGSIVPVHPEGKVIAGRRAVRRLEDLEGAIDAAFIGVNRHATIDTVAKLSVLGVGGAVCFASGFTEALSEDAEGAGLQARLVAAAGEMPVLGPNCYGFVNALDRVAIWPDQHGMTPVECGVAILTQSSNIAINLTMQRRALPIAYMVTCGNMAQTSQAEIAQALLADERVTAIGVHVEGFGDLRGWESLAAEAHRKGVPVVALKTGASEQARVAAMSHTASLAGSDAGAQAFLDRLGLARVESLTALLETLKLLHCTGPLKSGRIASISCSGGEASLIADTAARRGLVFPPLEVAQKQALRRVLGPMVALANPLDYHTYIWRDGSAMAAAWGTMTGPGIALTMSIVDFPHTDPADWACTLEAAIGAREATGAPFAVVSSLPELMPQDTAAALMQRGVVPLCGLDDALAAAAAAARIAVPAREQVLLPGAAEPGTLLSEAEAKTALAEFGLAVPRGIVAQSAADAGRRAGGLRGPLALKGLGLAHKTEAGAVRLGLAAGGISAAAGEMAATGFLVEEMVQDGVAELLVGVTRDPAHGFVLTLGAGGVLTEILRDTVSLLVPSPRAEVETALMRLRCAPFLRGYRGRPGADLDAILAAIESIQRYVVAHSTTLAEVEINPLICTPEDAVAADALIRKAGE